jgi:hypothetical protein
MLGGLALFVLAAAAPATATSISVATSFSMGLFHYDYTLTFDPMDPSDDDVLVIDVNVLPGDATFQKTGMPMGFDFFYDGGLGLITFLPDLAFPTGGDVGLFSFDSARSPAPTTFTAFTFDSLIDPIAFPPLTGQTMGPIGPAQEVIPEPATIALLTIGLGALGGRRAIRRRS